MGQNKSFSSNRATSAPGRESGINKLPQLINAAGTLTSLGGCRTRPEAVQAMSEAAVNFTHFGALLEQTGQYLAEVLEVPAALVTAGAAPGLTLAAAACMIADDLCAAARLPVPPPRHKIIIQCSHRSPFERAILFSGATLVQVGDAIRTRPADLKSAVDPSTAAILFFLQAEMLDSSLSLADTIEIAHAHNLPVIVDAAAELPPKSNLWELVQRGADLVVFSGGKDLRGPQASGLILGRKDLIASALMQSAPQEHVVGRVLKPDKSAVLGLVAAIEAYLKEDEGARFAEWEQIARMLEDGLNAIHGLCAARFMPRQPFIQPACIPRVAVHVNAQASLTIPELQDALWKGTPSIATEIIRGKIIFNVQTLTFSETAYILQRVDECFV